MFIILQLALLRKRQKRIDYAVTIMSLHDVIRQERIGHSTLLWRRLDKTLSLEIFLKASFQIFNVEPRFNSSESKLTKNDMVVRVEYSVFCGVHGSLRCDKKVTK